MEFPHRECHRTSLHYAQLIQRNKVIAFARNTIGSRSRGCGWSDRTLHAERAVVKSLGDVSQLRGCVLTVVRLNKQSEIMYSKPCASCVKFLEKCIKKYGLLKVLYAGSNQRGSQCTHNVSDSDSDSSKDSCSHV